MNYSRINVEINKLPATRKNVSLYDGDTVGRALAEAFGDSENWNSYSINVNGENSTLDTRLREGAVITLAKQTKGNSDEVAETPATVEVAEEEAPAQPFGLDAEPEAPAEDSIEATETTEAEVIADSAE